MAEANKANSLDDGVVQKDLVDEIKESPSGSSQETWREQLDRRLLMGQNVFVLLLKGAFCNPGKCRDSVQIKIPNET